MCYNTFAQNGVKEELTVAHMMKHNKASCGHMFAHFDRQAEHISNENVDRARSHQNYNLATHQDMGQGDFVKQRCSEVRCQNRKDVNVMVSWVITAPKDLPEQEHQAFFKASYDFCKNRYGEKNVVSSYVHMDEVTPHMHFAFVPVTEDKKRGGFKVSAKEVVNRADLQTFHSDLSDFLKQELGYEIGVINEATKEGNKSILELKRKSAAEQVQEATLEASKIVSDAQKEAQTIKDNLVAVNAEYEAKKAYIKEADKVSSISTLYPPEAKITEKGLINKQKYVTVPAQMWEAKHVSANEKSYVQKANKALEEHIKEFRYSSSGRYVRELELEIKSLREENAHLSYENSSLKERLHRAERTSDLIMEKVNGVVDQLPDDVAKQFEDAWNSFHRPAVPGLNMNIEM